MRLCCWVGQPAAINVSRRRVASPHNADSGDRRGSDPLPLEMHPRSLGRCHRLPPAAAPECAEHKRSLEYEFCFRPAF
jgi:hypothetical protein